MKELVSSKLKANSLGQCIVQAACHQTALLPLPLALTLSIDTVIS